MFIHSLYNTRHTIVFIAFLKYLIFSSFKNTINGSFAVKWLPGFFVFSCFPKDFMSRFLSQCRSLVQYFGSNEIRDRMFSMAALASLNSRNMKKNQKTKIHQRNQQERTVHFARGWVNSHPQALTNKPLFLSYKPVKKLVNKKNTYHHYSYEIQFM